MGLSTIAKLKKQTRKQRIIIWEKKSSRGEARGEERISEDEVVVCTIVKARSERSGGARRVVQEEKVGKVVVCFERDLHC